VPAVIAAGLCLYDGHRRGSRESGGAAIGLSKKRRQNANPVAAVMPGSIMVA
jgi:hypothetical protein